MTPIWRIQNGQGPSWKYAQARIDSDTNYQVPNLSGLKTKSSLGCSVPTDRRSLKGPVLKNYTGPVHSGPQNCISTLLFFSVEII